MNSQERIMISAAQLYDRSERLKYTTSQVNEEMQKLTLSAARGNVSPYQIKEAEESIAKVKHLLHNVKSILARLKEDAKTELNIQIYMK